MSKKFAKILELKPGYKKAGKELREKSIEDAVALSKGPSRDEMDYHVLWTGHGYEVGVGKPGKETTRKVPNPFDMWPFIRKDGIFEEKSATFADIFRELEHVGRQSPHALELLGSLFARSALMLDHEIEKDRVIYAPDRAVLDDIAQHIPMMFNVPMEVFLQYIEAIALNEDVKYQMNLNSRGKRYGKAAGRPNNLLTCAHLIVVLLRGTGIVDFARGFAQMRGVSPLKQKDIPSSFPLLGAETDLETSD